MAIYHKRSKKKATGGLLKDYRKVRNCEVGRAFTKTTIGEKKVHAVRGLGGNVKIALRQDTVVNVDGGKKKVAIDKILENKANPQFVRSGIITKGAVVETKAGKVKITSRPGQDGVLNGVVVK